MLIGEIQRRTFTGRIGKEVKLIDELEEILKIMDAFSRKKKNMFLSIRKGIMTCSAFREIAPKRKHDTTKQIKKQKP